MADVGHYTRAHKCFVQLVSNQGTLSLQQAIESLQKVLNQYGDGDNANVTVESLHKFVDQINAKLMTVEQLLSFVHMEIYGEMHEFLVYCFTNELGIPKGMIYSEIESNYMKSLIESIVQHENASITIIDAINLSTQYATSSQSVSKRITQKRAQELIEDWTKFGYFLKIDETIQLGPRSIGEFGSTLRIKFPDNVWGCHLCNQITFKPCYCPKPTCDAVLDKHCAEKYLKKSKKCPKCRTAWEFDDQ